MQNNQYTNAFAEVYEIIEHLSEDLKNKIPKQFINFIQENKNKNHIFVFDENNSINNQIMLEETKTLITIIYREFLCSQGEKEEIDKILEENEKEFQKELSSKYSIEKIFANRNLSGENKSVEKTEQLELIKYKENFFQKILKKIRLIFG